MADGFARLLRSHRLRNQLTQEALAERAGLSSRSVGEMERNRGRSPRPRTVERLAAALELSGDDQTEFLDAGRLLFWTNRIDDAEPAVESAAALAAQLSRAIGPELPPGPPRQLPVDFPDFVGRRAELAVLDRILDPDPPGVRLATISGPPGVGKSALAVHAGHRLATRFPDGQLYVVLGGGEEPPADPADVLAQLLRMLGVDGSALPAGVDARAGMFRARLAGRRLLLVLDDAAGHHQVQPLLPAEGAAVIVTSRLPLTGLPGATTLDLAPLPSSEAVELLGRVAGVERVRAEPQTATELVAACGNLPLAVRVVAARLAARPHWRISVLAERLADERRRLDELRHGDLAVRPSLRVSHRGLSPAAARAFALLGALGIPSFPEWTVAALLDVPPASAATTLEELLDARLVDALGPDRAGQPRYRFHEVTRLYARECRESEIGEAEWVEAFGRAATGWLAMARRAQDGLQCERFHLESRRLPATVVDERAAAVPDTDPIEWFEAEREVLAALIPACVTAGLTGVARGLAACGAEFYELRGYYDDWRGAMQTVHTASHEAGDRESEAVLLRGLGTCLMECADWKAAESTLRAARTLAEQVGDAAGAAMARKELGYMFGLTGRLDEADVELRAAAEALGRTGRDAIRAIALTSLGFVRRERGDADAAVHTVYGALEIARRLDDRFVEAYASRGLAGALLAAGRHREAERAARRAATLFQRIGDPIGAAQSLRSLGEALAREPNRLIEAEWAFGAAAAVFRNCGNSWGFALTELSLGETELRRGAPEAGERLRRALAVWVAEDVPALRARTLVALAAVAERAGDPARRRLLTEAYELYREIGAAAAAELAERLELDARHSSRR